MNSYDRHYSVIVPVYNAESTLNRCVDSILAQSYGNFELILVDDGSRDRSGDIIDQYAAQDPRVIAIHKTNGGVSSARNAGLDCAQGDYVAFIDADDYIAITYLSDFLNKEDDLIIGGYKMFGDSYSSEYLEQFVVLSCEEKIDMIEDNFVSPLLRTPWAKVFKRSIIAKNSLSFIPHLRLGEDTVFVLSFIHYCNSISTISVNSYFYYSQDQRLTYYRLTAEDYEKSISSIECALAMIGPKIKFKRSLNLIRTVFKSAFDSALLNFGIDFAKENSLKWIKLRMWRYYPNTSLFVRIRKSVVMFLWPILYRKRIRN